MAKKIIVSLILASLCLCALAQDGRMKRQHQMRHTAETTVHSSVSTNVADWAYFGTINGAGSYAVSRYWTVNAMVKFNPWTWNSQDSATQINQKQQTYSVGMTLWPWTVYSGWWFGALGQYSEYNRGGLWSRETEEGDAMGLSLGFGYSLMLHRNINLGLGVYGWGGQKTYTTYECPTCGRIVDSGVKGFVDLNTLLVSLEWMF